MRGKRRAPPGGGVVVAGLYSQKASPDHDLWLMRTDDKGRPAWQRTYGAFGSDVATAVVALPDGGLMVAGRTVGPPGTGQQAWVLRTDAYGHATCAASGVCAGKSVAACDDGQPCTADSCEAATGCTHTPIAGCP